MAVTKAQAIEADEFHHGTCTLTFGPRGGEKETITRYRRMGATRTWKTRPDDFRVPVKFGMRAHDSWEITPDNAAEFHTAKNCPLENTEYRERRNDGRIIEVSKWGGGTLGKRYDGSWDVRLFDPNGVVLLDDVMQTGTPKNHREVAQLALGFQENE